MTDVSLLFSRNYGMYLAGQTATFPASAIANILASGAATVLPPQAKTAESVVADRKHAKIIKK